MRITERAAGASHTYPLLRDWVGFTAILSGFASAHARARACASHGTRTSPVKRCTEVMNNLLDSKHCDARYIVNLRHKDSKWSGTR